MDETAKLGLPLVQAAQAQKHVTVNEALTRIDGLLPMTIAARDRVSPPPVVSDGVVFAIPDGAQGEWAGQDGKLAVASNGGWGFVTPQAGWRAFLLPEGVQAVHDGAGWISGALTLLPDGAGMRAGLVDGEQVLSAGSSIVTDITIPEGAMVIGVTARVTADISGSLQAWRIGTGAATDRFGSGLGLPAGSWGRGVLGSPMTYYSEEPLVLTAEGGSFSAGTVRLAIHFLDLRLPNL